MSSKLKEIRMFKLKYAFLSNFYPSEVTYKDIKYPSVEHAYQSAKTNNIKIRKKISLASSAYQAKKIGRTVELIPNWDLNRLSIMYYLLEQKFCIPELRYKLIELYNYKIVEGNYWHDNYWGDCSCKKCIDTIGLNYLGKLIMHIGGWGRKI